MTITIDQALAELDAPTADEVADKLRAAGVKGEPAEPEFCPVARYLQNRTGLPITVCAEFAAHKTLRYSMPSAVGEFMGRFDVDEYPDLVETT